MSAAMGSGAGRRHNDLLAIALIAVLGLAPLPFGSNTPIAWIGWGLVLGAIGFVYMARFAGTLRVPLGRIWPLAAGWGLVAGYMVLQVPPLTGAGPISLAPTASVLSLLQWTSLGVLVVLVVQAGANRQRAYLMLYALFAVTVLYAAWGLFELKGADTLLGIDKWAYEGSLTATFVNRNSAATFLALGATAGAGLLLEPALEHRRGILGFREGFVVVGLALIFVAILATDSRMGLFVGALGPAVVAAQGLWRARSRPLVVVLGCAIVAALAALAVWFYGAGTLERLIAVGPSADSRAELYRQVVELIRLRPLTGFGAGTFEIAFPLVHDPVLSTAYVWDRAHSSYLTNWAELGLVVGTVPLLLLAGLAWSCLRAMAVARSHWAAGAIGLGAIIVGAVHSLVDFSLEMQANAMLLAALAGLGAARSYQDTKEGLAHVEYRRVNVL